MSLNKKHYTLKSFHLERIKNKCITEGNLCYTSEKEADLTQQKEYLKQILASIKAIQVSILSDTNSRKNNNPYTKNLISQMKENLSRTLKQKNKKYNVLIDNYNLKVEEMQIKIFSPENKRNLLKLNSSINESFSREINEKYFNDELTQLKTMNFKLENDIQQAEYSIRRKSNLQFLLKNNEKHNEQESFKEIICKSQKEYPLVSRILHKEAVETKKFFTYIVSMKTFQNLEIDDIQNSINRLKNIISREGKIIDSQDIIKEESSDYYSNITNAIEQTLNKTKILNNNEISNIKVNDVSDMINSFCANQKKLDINDFQKFLNLNMNINVNINLNKNEIVSDEYANENNKKTNSKSQKISNGNNKNKNSSTGALPQIITKTLNEKFKFMPIFINDEEVNKKEKISEFRSSMTNRRDLQKCVSYSPTK